MSQLNLDKLSFVVCPTTFPDPQYQKMYSETFRFWWSSWEAVFREKKAGQKLTSDMFTRQHFTGSLFYGEACIGQICYRVVDTDAAPSRHDSYFHNWGPEGLSALTASGGRILISSYLAVDPAYRGHEMFGASVKDLLIGFCGFLKDQCGTPHMAAATRKERHVNRACLDWGAVVVEESIPSGFGDLVDLVVFPKDCQDKAKENPLYLSVHNLWKNRLLIFQDQNVTAFPISA